MLPKRPQGKQGRHLNAISMELKAVNVKLFTTSNDT